MDKFIYEVVFKQYYLYVRNITITHALVIGPVGCVYIMYMVVCQP